MQRRQFVRAVLSILAAPKLLFSQQAPKPALPPPAPVPWTLGLNPLTPIPHTDAEDGLAEMESHFFPAAQMATLNRLCDVLMPRIADKPGALDAETPLFLDFLLGASPDSRQKVYTGGLTWLDGEAQKQFKKPFVKLNDTEAGSVLKPWLRTWMSDHPPTELHASFINIAHDDIRAATMNSKTWIQATSTPTQQALNSALFWFPIEPDSRGLNATLTRVPARVVDAPKASHTMPSYPR